MLNFLGLLKAPDQPAPLARYVATYSNGFGLQRREIDAPSWQAAYAIARVRPPEGFELTHFRKARHG